jgi:integrase/recombinase XerD
MNNATQATITQTWHAVLDRLEGAFAPATLRHHRDSFSVFAAWCASRGAEPLPASAAEVAAFLADQSATASPSTLKRRLSAIRRLHHLSGLPDPTDDEVVVIALRRAQRANPRRPAQALGLTRARRDRLMAACGTDMIGLRNRALLAVGYDTLCRQCELVALRVEDLESLAGDRLRVLVRRAKNDPFGMGRTAWISAAAARELRAWLAAAGITRGPLFRPVRHGMVLDRQLGPTTVTRVLQKLGRLANLPQPEAARLSGHSLRVGAAQDLMTDGRSIAVIMRAGGWKSQAIVARYTQAADPGIWTDGSEKARIPGESMPPPRGEPSGALAPATGSPEAGPEPGSRRAEDWRAAIRRLDGAFAASTMRSYRNDFAAFAAWCAAEDLVALPATASAVAGFLDDQASRLSPATVRRRVAGIRKVHRLMQHPDPTADDAVSHALRRASRMKPCRPEQALALTRGRRDALIAACGSDMRGLRDRALVAVGYDTLCRRSEIVALRIEDIAPRARGGATVMLRRSRTSPVELARTAWLSTDGARLLHEWLEAAAIAEGPVFRPVYQNVPIERFLHSYTVNRLLKELALRAGLPPAESSLTTSHSLRIGAAQDLREAGRDMLTIMRAGGWTSTNVLSSYLEQADMGLWD